jgi:hypothetical protein
MRFFEFLAEASIFTRGTYTYGHKVKTATNAEKGRMLADIIKRDIPDYDGSEELEWVEDAPGDAPRIQAGKGTETVNFKRPNGEVFTLVGSLKSIQGGLNHAGEHKKFNKGDIAEGVLGAALTAKLIKRGSDQIGTVDVSDIKRVLGAAVASKHQTYEVNDKNSKIADKIVFNVNLTGPSLEIISDTSQWDKFKEIFDSSAHYANSGDAERYSNHFYKNGKVDEVMITSDGLSGQKSRKTDINVVVRDPATGKVRNLKNVDISLKADSSQYGQVGTGGKSGGNEKWIASATKLFAPFGVSIETPSKSYPDIVSFYKDIYENAAHQMMMLVAGDNENKEAQFVQKVADVIFHHATLNAPNVRIVNLEKGESTIHSFAGLKQRMLENNVNLDVDFTIGRSGYPTISIFDANSKQVLTKIRYFSTKTGDKSAHVFEKGPLLHELTKVVKARTAQPNTKTAEIPPETDKIAAPADKTGTAKPAKSV